MIDRKYRKAILSKRILSRIYQYLFLILLLCVVESIPWSRNPLFSTSSSSSSSTAAATSLLRIDPQKIVSMICKYGGIILPKTIERDLKLLESTCQCDETSLDLINRELKVSNLTIAMPPDDLKDTRRQRPAVRVERVYIRWDSYIKPCFEIEVDNVDVLVEFVNLILTRNNWNELKDIGFPPTFYDYKETDNDTVNNKQSKSLLSTFITIGSIDLSGKVVLRVQSRVLDKKVVDDVEFDLDKLDVINENIKNTASEAMKKNGRKGCTTDEIYDILQSAFNGILQQLLKSTLMDLAWSAVNGNSESKALHEGRKAFLGAKGSILGYVKNVEDKTKKDFSQNLGDLGLNANDIDLAKNLFRSSTNSLFNTKKQ